jgi:hypothetical protein
LHHWTWQLDSCLSTTLPRWFLSKILWMEFMRQGTHSGKLNQNIRISIGNNTINSTFHLQLN